MRNLDDQIVWNDPEATCTSLHGEAGNGEVAVFGCTGGVLVLQQSGSAFTQSWIANPAEVPSYLRVGQVWGNDRLSVFYGEMTLEGESGGLFRIDPDKGEMRMVQAGSPNRAVAVTITSDGALLLTVTEDGTFTVFKAASGKKLRSLSNVIGPVSDHSEHGYRHPDIAVDEHRAYVADPAEQRVVEIDIDRMKIVRTFPVSGAPTKMVFLGAVEPMKEVRH